MHEKLEARAASLGFRGGSTKNQKNSPAEAGL
jgi:hypothetical protein